MVLGLLRRAALSVGGSALGAVAVAAFEARRAASLDHELPPPGTLFLADLGLLAPLALLIGLLVTLATALFEPGPLRSPREHLRDLRDVGVLARSRSAALVPLAVVAAFTLVVAAAHLGKARLAEGKPADAGILLGVETIAVLVVLLAGALTLATPLRRALAAGATRAPWLIDPAVTGGLALALVAGLFAIGVTSGDTSGNGAHPLAILGVLKRAELDLTPLWAALALAGGAYALAVFARHGTGLAAPASTLPAVLFTLALCARDARHLNQEPELTRGLARHASLGKIGLALLRRATDRDHDGASPLFGGGDCDDRDKGRYPEAIDVPGNGVDEDCSGADTPAPSKPPPPVVQAAKKQRKLNVILITIDTLRTDLGFMGYPKPVSPNMDRLAKRSVVFDRAYAMASYTGKSLGPLHIGKFPSETLRDGGHFNVYAPKNVFVAERASAAGFATLGAMSHFYFKPTFGLSQGFERWDLSAIPPGLADNDNSMSSEALSNVVLKMLASPGAGASAPALDAGADAADGGTQGRPFFAWFHYFDPHAQYAPHPDAPNFGEGEKGAAAWVHAMYDAEVWYTDKHLGRVLDAIEAAPWAAETAIVLTADHGEALGDHGMSWHGAEIWESLVHVPLLVYVPGVEPHRVASRRSHIDLAPTMLELMGIEAPAGELSGQSLVPEVDRVPGAEADRDTFVDMPIGPFNGTRRALLSGPGAGMKLIHLGGTQYQLFDLAADPGERTDLARDKERLEPMKAAMQAFRARLKEIEVKPAEN